MNAKRKSQNILFIGLDWADQEHVCDFGCEIIRDDGTHRSATNS